MKRHGVIHSLLLLLCLLWLGARPATAQTVDQTDNQFWSDLQFAVPVTKNFDFNVLGTLRLGRDITHAVDERIGVGFTFRYGKYLSVSPNYLHIGMQPSEGRRIWENRLSLPVQIRFNSGHFRITDRNLFERRMRNSGLKQTRYRQRLQVDHPVGEKDWQLSLYVADEVFYDWLFDSWSRNRFTVGATKVFNKHFQEDFYYLRQNDGISVPGDLNVIGTSLRVRL